MPSVRSLSLLWAGVGLSGQAGGATKASLEMAEAAAEGRTEDGGRAGGSDADSGAGNSVIGRRGAKIRNALTVAAPWILLGLGWTDNLEDVLDLDDSSDKRDIA